MTSDKDMQPKQKKPGTSENFEAPRAQESTTLEKGPGAGFPIVAIGASAGGLEAFEHSLANCRQAAEWPLSSSSIWTRITKVCREIC